MTFASRMLVLAVCLLPLPAQAAGQVDGLARNVARAESLRSVKNLQRNYAQYVQFGLWRAAAGLFSTSGTLNDGEGSAKGPAAIEPYLSGKYGAPGEVHTMLIEAPVVNLSVDGNSAKGRWRGFFLLGKGEAASFEGGIFENDYVKQNGAWKIAALHFFPQYGGPYETGWVNWQGGELPAIAMHYTADEAGIPIPAPAGAAPKSGASLNQLERRVAALKDEAEVRNLQAAYGYYLDRKMWDDVTDLFAANSVLEIGGIGIYDGPKGVRRALERMGPANLSHGQLNDYPQFDTVVTVTPGGAEAHARGIEIGMTGEADKGTAYWEINVFDNRFVKEAGLWKVREMRIFPLLKSEYSKGWGKSRIVDPAPSGAAAPDHAVPAADAGDQGTLLPAFPGAKISAPGDMKLVATKPLTGTLAEIQTNANRLASEELVKKILAEAKTTGATHIGFTGIDEYPNTGARLDQAATDLRVATAYDGVENLSSAYGDILDDWTWPMMGAIFAQGANKQDPFAGYYLGGERIAHSDFVEYGNLPEHRLGISLHWRTQPVINVSADGRSANLRTRLWHPSTNQKRPGTFQGAMYPDDQAVLENGVWRLWSITIDEPYFSSPDWKGGWSAAKDPVPGQKPRPSVLLSKFPPDIPMTVLSAREEHFRGGTGEAIEWPGILPMWFNYKNPVSGRTPEHYWPDCVPCEYAPDTSMTHHGYQMPRLGP